MLFDCASKIKLGLLSLSPASFRPNYSFRTSLLTAKQPDDLKIETATQLVTLRPSLNPCSPHLVPHSPPTYISPGLEALVLLLATKDDQSEA